MAVVHSWYNLSEEVPGLPFRDVPLVTNVVIQVPSAGVLHHNHNFVLIFKYWRKKNIYIYIRTLLFEISNPSQSPKRNWNSKIIWIFSLDCAEPFTVPKHMKRLHFHLPIQPLVDTDWNTRGPMMTVLHKKHALMWILIDGHLIRREGH